MVQAGLAAPYGQYGQGGDAATLALAAAAAAGGGVPNGAGSVMGLPAGIKMEKDEVSGVATTVSSGGLTMPSSTTAVTSSMATMATSATMAAAAAAALDTLSPILVNGVDQTSVTAVIIQLIQLIIHSIQFHYFNPLDVIPEFRNYLKKFHYEFTELMPFERVVKKSIFSSAGFDSGIPELFKKKI